MVVAKGQIWKWRKARIPDYNNCEFQIGDKLLSNSYQILYIGPVKFGYSSWSSKIIMNNAEYMGKIRKFTSLYDKLSN